MSIVDWTVEVSGGIVNFNFTTIFRSALMFTREHQAPFSGRLKRKKCVLHHLTPKPKIRILRNSYSVLLTSFKNGY